MEIDFNYYIGLFSNLAHQLEGEYKWYVLGGVLLIITALITRFIFRTFKWFLLLLLLGAVIFGVFWSMNYVTL